MATRKTKSTETSSPVRAFQVEILESGVAVVTLDVPGESQNTLKAAFAAEFEEVIGSFEQDDAIRAIVIRSGKPDSFLAGADIGMLEQVRTAKDATSLSQSGQRAFDRLERLPIPVVAAIHGPCLGGGLELALACTSRVATDDRKTKLGLPEVMLGLLPGAGGTQRLPRLVGIATALDLMLTGKQLDGKRAARMGLVDEVVRPSILLDTAIARALRLAGGAAARPARRPTGVLDQLRALGDADQLKTFLLEENPVGRTLLFQQARKQLRSKTLGNYPAPERILDVVEIGMNEGMTAGLRAEAERFGELVVSAEARQLMNIFRAQTALKKDSGVDDPDVGPRPLHHVGVLGAGLMGSGIAHVTATLAEIDVRLKDRDAAGVAAGLRSVRGILDKRVRRRRVDAREADRQFQRITGTTDYSGFANTDLVIEAVFEDLDLKHRMIRDIEAHGRPDTIFGSNTSSIPIARIAEASKHPETVIGLHYFSPVDKMPLLEIIVTPQTAPWVTATCVELGKKQGKTVIVVRDGVGFYTSRILGPYMNEAAWVLSEGVAVDRIDRALRQWGYPVGPITLLDEVGIDVAEKVGHIMVDAFGERMVPPGTAGQLVADKRLGRKNKRGFYTYDDRKKKEVDTSVYPLLGIQPTNRMDEVEIAERCAYQMINEAALCWQDGILRSPRDGDIGAIFGLGFPPFRGGPFRYLDAIGVQAFVDRMKRFEQQHGLRFRPAQVLVDMAARGERFHRD